MSTKEKKFVHRSSIYNKHVVFFMTLCDALVISLLCFNFIQWHSRAVASCYKIIWNAFARIVCSNKKSQEREREREKNTDGTRSNRVEKHVIFALILHIISSHFCFVLGNLDLFRLMARSTYFCISKWVFFCWLWWSPVFIITIVVFLSPKFVSTNNQMRQLYNKIYILFNFQTIYFSAVIWRLQLKQQRIRDVFFFFSFVSNVRMKNKKQRLHLAKWRVEWNAHLTT